MGLKGSDRFVLLWSTIGILAALLIWNLPWRFQFNDDEVMMWLVSGAYYYLDYRSSLACKRLESPTSSEATTPWGDTRERGYSVDSSTNYDNLKYLELLTPSPSSIDDMTLLALRR
jgi:hypothetical protein